MAYKKFLVGFAIADAIGVPVEFSKREVLKKNPVVGMREHGTYDQPAGTWSDDTTMTIATMESIARLKTVDYTDIMANFAKWYNNDDFTIDGLFDIGRTTSRTIRRFIEGTPALNCGDTEEHQNGNGSLMRILPIAVYLYSKYGNNFNEEAMNIIHNMSGLTHAHQISKMCCGFYCLTAAELLEGKTAKEAVAIGLDKGVTYYKQHEEFADFLEKIFGRLLKSDFANLPEDEIEGSGYVLHSLEASIWCLLNTNDYKSLILKAVNLGRDTDTTGAISSGLGALLYNVDDLPAEWINTIRKKSYLQSIETAFFQSLD